MKKLLLFSTILSYQLFAVECTQAQYSPYFTDNKKERYLFASKAVVDNGLSVFDKKSVKFDNKNIIKAWIVFQGKGHPKFDIMKVFMEFNIKDNTCRYLEHVAYNCKGKLLGSENGDNIWEKIIPESNNEVILDSLKKYLKIK